MGGEEGKWANRFFTSLRMENKIVPKEGADKQLKKFKVYDVVEVK